MTLLFYLMEVEKFNKDTFNSHIFIFKLWSWLLASSFLNTFSAISMQFCASAKKNLIYNLKKKYILKSKTIENKFCKFKISNICIFWDQSPDMSSSAFPPKNRPLIGWLTWSINLRHVLWQETTWTHVLTRISKKTDFSTLNKTQWI